MESPQPRPHWLLLIYSFQFRSPARAAPARRPCLRAAPDTAAVTNTCGVNSSIDVMLLQQFLPAILQTSSEFIFQQYSALVR